MSKKKLNIILLTAVILIWGGVLLKYASPYFKKPEIVVTAEALVTSQKAVIHKKDTFDLHLPDRDPFLGTVVTKTIKKVIIPKKSIKKVKPRVVVWPKIEYLGYVKSKKNNSRLGLIRVDGILKRIRKGSKIGTSLKVIAVEENQVSLQQHSDIRHFKK